MRKYLILWVHFTAKKIQDSLMIIEIAKGGKKRGVLRQRGKDRRSAW